MTAEEFEQGYAERSGISVESLRKLGRVVVPCACGEKGCHGWASVSRESARRDYGGWVLPPRGSKPASEIWYQKPWGAVANG